MHRSPALFRQVLAQQTLPATPEGFAHDLYAAMRAMDGVDADIILIEQPPDEPAWQGVNDRLRRAAHGFVQVLEKFL